MSQARFTLWPYQLLAVTVPLLAFGCASVAGASAQEQQVERIFFAVLCAGNMYLLAIAHGGLLRTVLAVPLGGLAGALVVPALSYVPVLMLVFFLVLIGVLVIGYEFFSALLTLQLPAVVFIMVVPLAAAAVPLFFWSGLCGLFFFNSGKDGNWSLALTFCFPVVNLCAAMILPNRVAVDEIVLPAIPACRGSLCAVVVWLVTYIILAALTGGGNEFCFVVASVIGNYVFLLIQFRGVARVRVAPDGTTLPDIQLPPEMPPTSDGDEPQAGN